MVYKRIQCHVWPHDILVNSSVLPPTSGGTITTFSKLQMYRPSHAALCLNYTQKYFTMPSVWFLEHYRSAKARFIIKWGCPVVHVHAAAWFTTSPLQVMVHRSVFAWPGMLSRSGSNVILTGHYSHKPKFLVPYSLVWMFNMHVFFL